MPGHNGGVGVDDVGKTVSRSAEGEGKAVSSDLSGRGEAEVVEAGGDSALAKRGQEAHGRGVEGFRERMRGAYAPGVAAAIVLWPVVGVADGGVQEDGVCHEPSAANGLFVDERLERRTGGAQGADGVELAAIGRIEIKRSHVCDVVAGAHVADNACGVAQIMELRGSSGEGDLDAAGEGGVHRELHDLRVAMAHGRSLAN